MFQSVDPEPSAGNELVDSPVEMAPACESGPQRIKPILPPGNTRLRRASVLDEDQRAGKLEHAAHFGQRTRHIGDGAQGPGCHHGIDATVVERYCLGQA